MEKIERRKEQEGTEGTDNNRFWNSRLNKHRKRGEIKNRVTYSSCLHDQQDLCWGLMRHKWRTARTTINLNFLRTKKELFRLKKKIFHSFWRAIIQWKNKNLIKIADTSFTLRIYTNFKEERNPSAPSET